MPSDVVDARSLQVDAAIADYLESVERGTPLDQPTFIAEHSTIADELREFLGDYRALQQVAPLASVDCPADVVSGKLPRSFGDFELLEEIARGGMGVVYKAQQQSLGRIVALKMILAGEMASQTDIDRFYAEAHAAATLDHPLIVPIFEVGEHEGQHYFTMAFVDGESLAERLVRGPLPTRQAASIVQQVALAAHYAHGRGIIHRDLKPANILLDTEDRVRVTDFGLAKNQANLALTCAGQILGTLNYMPPEQMSGSSDQLGPTTDVYAMGATLYALVTGHAPFQAASALDTMQQVVEKQPVPPRELNPMIPRDLETIILKCLEKAAHHRFASACELAEDLKRFLDNRPILARRSSSAERLVRWCKRNRMVAALAASLAALLVAAVVILAKSNADFRDEAAAKDAALAMARQAVDQMLTRVANEKLNNVPLAHPLREALLKDALKFYEGMEAQAVGEAPLPLEMHQVLNSMGCIQRELGEYAAARDSFERSIALLEPMASTDPHPPAIREKIAETHKALAITWNMESVTASWREAEIQWHDTLRMYQDLERDWPDRPQPIGLCQMHLAKSAFYHKGPQEAERLWREAIASGEDYLLQNPADNDARNAVCWSCADLCDSILLVDDQRIAEAEPILNKGLQHSSIMLENDPHSAQAREVAAFLQHCLGCCYCRTGRVTLADESFRSSIHEMQQLCAEFPRNRDYWELVSYFEQEIVSHLQAANHQDEATSSVLEMLTWLDEITHRVPQEPTTHANLLRCRASLAELLRSVGEIQQADELTQTTISK